MKRLISKNGLMSMLVFGLGLGCSPASKYGAYNPEPYFPMSETFEYKMEQDIPKLDLVFIMDNSKSMHPHVTNLSANIRKFTEKFNPESIDLRVGVVTVADSTRFKQYASVDDPQKAEDEAMFNDIKAQAAVAYNAQYPESLSGVAEQLRSEIFQLNYPGYYAADVRYAYYADQGRLSAALPSGVLRPIRSSVGLDIERSYINSGDANFFEELENTLLVTKDFYEQAPGENDSWANLGAPVIEEVFSVVSNLTSSEVNVNWNRNFLRDDAYLAIVIVTDAEDSTKDPRTGELVTPEKIAGQLLEYKSKERLSVYGVLSILGEGIESCDTDGYAQVGDEFKPVRPDRITSFIRRLNGSTYSICSPDFGVELAAIGSDLVSKVYEVNDFPLSHTPTSRNDIRVFINDELVNDLAWTYNNYSQSISINSMYQTQATVRIEYLTPNPARLSSGEILPDGVQAN